MVPPAFSYAAGAAALPLVVLTTFLAAAGGASASTPATACTVVSRVSAGASPPSGLQIVGEQLSNAKTIVTVGRASGLPVQAAAVAVMTAQQESGLLNLDHGDRDSVGLFQQRPSQGWGTPAQLLDPTYAATAFYGHLTAVPGWPLLPMAEAAQRVQASADGSRYAAWAGFGTAVANALYGDAEGDLVCSQPAAYEVPAGVSPAGSAVLAFAQAQLGKPYVYGAAGPDNFDCSGLTLRAFQAVGIGLPRTSEEQWQAGPRLPADQLAVGDLVFFDPEPSGLPGHVGIYAGNGLMIDAPHAGAVVRLEPVEGFGTYMGARRPTNGHTA